MKTWARRVGLALGLLVLAALGGVLALIGPYLRDDLHLDRIVYAVALDWRDFGEERGYERLQYELDRRGVGLQVGDDACALTVEAEGMRAVRCRWSASVVVPVVGWSFALPFSSDALVGPDGSVR